MSFVLHGSLTSPYVRKVRVVAAECGLAEQVHFSPASGSPLDPGTVPLALNPLGKIPVLERPEGPALYDSRVICRFLDSLSGTGLYPDGPALWDALTLEATGDGILDAAVAMVYEARLRPQAMQSAEFVEGQWAKIARALQAVEARWLGHLAGRVHVGQIALAVALGYLDFRHGPRDWRALTPQLDAWYAGWQSRPGMVETAPSE